ncbi:UPAR/Ly6 domain-containing protein bou isoform X2 [Linepithema humile]|uniref:UPAR/Ly6 domain-containing protein bou isoform X2 n=1 Tax=Linepithema humile TaxID=83485 RepID=UPI00351F7787
MGNVNFAIGVYILLVFSLLIETGYSIRCYRCNSTSTTYPFQCNEFLKSDVDLQPESCNDVYGAQYCVKHIGRFEAIALDCYQCASGDEWKCMDGDLVANFLVPANCSHVHDARYCIKSIGRYGGGIGTKRFCSSAHLGNYCDYVKQPGDKLTYRTCVYTCSTDGCNSAKSFVPSTVYTWIMPMALLVIWTKLFHSRMVQDL